MNKRSIAAKQGFTLVELIIVIIILGILAALAIPQFTSSTQDARDSTLKGDLAVLRNAISLYYHEHNDTYPGSLKETDGTTATDATTAPAAFQAQLTGYTDKTGKVSPTAAKVAPYTYGPYVQAVPVSPLAGSIATLIKAVNTTPFAAEASPTAQWLYNYTNGQIEPNSTASDASAKTYVSY